MARAAPDASVDGVRSPTDSDGPSTRAVARAAYDPAMTTTNRDQPQAERAPTRAGGFPKPFYRYRPHPWHGLAVGPEPPRRINAFIEITPFDLVKYEVDKETGYLWVDRPQRSSSLPPTLYGFVPRTYCGDRVGALIGGEGRGDGDPLDVCVISERPINRSEVILVARVVGGIRLIDRGEVDDKVIAVLENDPVWGEAQEIEHLPKALVERMRHYFAYYKLMPGEKATIEVRDVFGRLEAERVVTAAMEDYAEAFGA